MKIRYFVYIPLYILISSSISCATSNSVARNVKPYDFGAKNHSQPNHQGTFAKERSAAEQFTYKKIDETVLKAYVYQPDSSQTNDLTVVVFFHGGAWTEGAPVQFEKQALYLKNRGIVAITIDYRLKKRNGTTPFEALQDAKSAIRWVRENAGKLHINPKKVIAAGGSAGGQLAVATAIIDEINDPADNLNVSPVPNALVLFNPVLDMKKWEHNFKVDMSAISPLQKLQKQLPPTIIFQGTSDKVAPFAITEKFVQKARSLGSNNVRLVAYPGRIHSFFNADKGENKDFTTTTQEAFEFIKTLGW